MIEFKTSRERSEFGELVSKNPKLFYIITQLADYTMNTYGKSIVLTSIYRSPEENAILYKDTPVDKRPKAQPHTIWGAVDVRSHNFTEEEITATTAWGNAKFKNPSGKAICIYHCIAGGSPHWHWQYATT
jgi:hypothetical protein